MDDPHELTLQELAIAFRHTIETARVERAPGALPYFPHDALSHDEPLIGSTSRAAAACGLVRPRATRERRPA